MANKKLSRFRSCEVVLGVTVAGVRQLRQLALEQITLGSRHETFD